MERKFECGNEALLRVSVCAIYNEEGVYDYDVSYVDHDTGENKIIPVIEEQLTTASKAPNIDWQATYNEYSEKARRTIADLSKRITELNALLKNAQTRVDQLESALSMRNDANLELEKKNRELEESQSTKKGEVKHWRGMYMHMKERCNEYKRAADHLKEERDRADDELALTKIMNIALAEKIERMQNNG